MYVCVWVFYQLVHAYYTYQKKYGYDIYMLYFLPLRFIGKLDIKAKELEPLLSSITDLYSSGAVEGYTVETLFVQSI